MPSRQKKVSQTLPVSLPPLAAIDIGTTAIRMTIAQIDSMGKVHPIEFLFQSISLGKDTFTKGFIKKTSIEECVKTLKSFRLKLDEYGIISPKHIRAIATAAVREATNKDAFIDRILVSTGFVVEPIEDIDVTRLTYLSAYANLGSGKEVSFDNTLIIEVGGGNTELVYINKGNVRLSQSFRMGSLRIRQELESFHGVLSAGKTLIQEQMSRTINQIKRSIDTTKPLTILPVGGDLRFAASTLHPSWNGHTPLALSVSALSKLTDTIASCEVNDLVKTHHLTFADAETIGPALLFYVRLAKALQVKTVFATEISMRHGLLMEMARRGSWVENFASQIISSAREIGRKYETDESHAEHVSLLAREIFRICQPEHCLGFWEEMLLSVAAHVHDIGLFVSTRSHHKHSMYLIQNSDLFGLTNKEIIIVSLIARYHRKATPRPDHIEYMQLDRTDRLIVTKLAAILRVADALDRSHSQRVKNIKCFLEESRFIIAVRDIDELSLEQFSLQNKANMFEEVYGHPVVLRKHSNDL